MNWESRLWENFGEEVGSFYWAKRRNLSIWTVNLSRRFTLSSQIPRIQIIQKFSERFLTTRFQFWDNFVISKLGRSAPNEWISTLVISHSRNVFTKCKECAEARNLELRSKSFGKAISSLFLQNIFLEHFWETKIKSK